LGDLLDRTEDDERRQLGPAHQAREIHLQEAGVRQRFDHCGRDAPQPLAFIARTRARAAAITSASAGIGVEGGE
jgi:hypothetical protein